MLFVVDCVVGNVHSYKQISFVQQVLTQISRIKIQMDNDFIIVIITNVAGIIIAITISIKGCMSFKSRKKQSIVSSLL